MFSKQKVPAKAVPKQDTKRPNAVQNALKRREQRMKGKGVKSASEASESDSSDSSYHTSGSESETSSSDSDASEIKGSRKRKRHLSDSEGESEQEAEASSGEETPESSDSELKKEMDLPESEEEDDDEDDTEGDTDDDSLLEQHLEEEFEEFAATNVPTSPDILKPEPDVVSHVADIKYLEPKRVFKPLGNKRQAFSSVYIDTGKAYEANREFYRPWMVLKAPDHRVLAVYDLEYESAIPLETSKALDARSQLFRLLDSQKLQVPSLEKIQVTKHKISEMDPDVHHLAVEGISEEGHMILLFIKYDERVRVPAPMVPIIYKWDQELNMFKLIEKTKNQ